MNPATDNHVLNALYGYMGVVALAPLILLMGGWFTALPGLLLTWFAFHVIGRRGAPRLAGIGLTMPVIGLACGFLLLFVRGLAPGEEPAFVVLAMLLHLLILVLAMIAFAVGRRKRRAAP